MRRKREGLGPVLAPLLAMCLAGDLSGQDLVKGWSVNLTGDEALPTYEIFAARVRADGSKLVVVNSRGGPWAVRFSVTGSVLSGVPLSGVYGVAADCDALGAVFVVEPSSVVKAFDGTTGALLWASRSIELDYASDRGHSLAVDAGGDPIVAANVYDETRRLSLILFRLDRRTGTVVWGPIPVPSAEGFVVAPPIVRAGEEGIVVAANLVPPSCYYYPEAGCGVPVDSVLARPDRETGELLWQTVERSTGVSDVRVGSRGRLLVSARPASGPGYLDVRRTVDGSVVWRRTRPGDPTVIAASAAAFDPSGHVLLAAANEVVKYDGSTGRTAWGPVPSPDLKAMAVDGAGSPFLLTAPLAGGASLAKLEAGSGRRIWTSDLVHGVDASVVLVTPGGDAFVAAGGGRFPGTLTGQQHEGQSGHPVEPLSRSLDRGLQGTPSLQLLSERWADGDALVRVLSIVARLERATGRELWRSSVFGSIRVSASGNIYALGFDSPGGRYRVTRLDPRTGAEVFRVERSSTTYNLRLGLPSDGTVRIARLGTSTSIDEIDVLRAEDGAFLEKRVLVGRVISELEPQSGDVITSGSGSVMRVDPRGGSYRWSRPLPFASASGPHRPRNLQSSLCGHRRRRGRDPRSAGAVRILGLVP